MKHKLTTVLLLFVFPITSFAQEDYVPGLEGGFYGGLSIPMGNFAKNELLNSDDHCGCANTNGSLAIKFRVRIKKSNFFVNVGVQRAWNTYNPKPLVQTLIQDYGGGFGIKSESWKSNLFQLGAGYDFLLNNDEELKWYLSFDVAGVLNELETYSFETYSTNTTANYPIYQKSMDDWNGGYSVGTGLSVLWDGLGAKLSIEYVNTNHRIEGASRHYIDGNTVPVSYNQNVQLLLVQLGIIVRMY